MWNLRWSLGFTSGTFFYFFITIQLYCNCLWCFIFTAMLWMTACNWSCFFFCSCPGSLELMRPVENMVTAWSFESMQLAPLFPFESSWPPIIAATLSFVRVPWPNVDKRWRRSVSTNICWKEKTEQFVIIRDPVIEFSRLIINYRTTWSVHSVSFSGDTLPETIGASAKTEQVRFRMKKKYW